jgi:CRISPR-associated protein Cas2
MLVMILEKVPGRARGELTHWLLEVKTGVFVGHVSRGCAINCGEVRQRAGDGGVTQIWSTNTEQRFQIGWRATPRGRSWTSRDCN